MGTLTLCLMTDYIALVEACFTLVWQNIVPALYCYLWGQFSNYTEIREQSKHGSLSDCSYPDTMLLTSHACYNSDFDEKSQVTIELFHMYS